jgi:uncharacterized protein YkwD/uncharacterized membrane protein required for colicin V production
MNYVDVLLLLVVLFSVIRCLQQGFIRASLELLASVGSLLFAFLVNKPLSSIVHHLLPSAGIWTAPLIFIITGVIGKLFLDQLAGRTIYAIRNTIHKHPVNRVLGILPGLVNGLIWSTFLAAFLLLFPFPGHFGGQVQDSKYANPLVLKLGWVGQEFSSIFTDAFARSKSRNGKVGEEEFVKLPFTLRKFKVRNDLEAQMLVLLNQERIKNNLTPLKSDLEMREVARRHSADMFFRGYFSHITPEGADPFDRMAAAHIGFIIAGENLALAQTLRIAHVGLMNSAGHRANILNPAFGRVGIGVQDGGIHGLMFTQNFRN